MFSRRVPDPFRHERCQFSGSAFSRARPQESKSYTLRFCTSVLTCGMLPRRHLRPRALSAILCYRSSPKASSKSSKCHSYTPSRKNVPTKNLQLLCLDILARIFPANPLEAHSYEKQGGWGVTLWKSPRDRTARHRRIVGRGLRAAAGRPYSARKFFRSCFPESVSTDSGWNCTPSTGYFLCRRPMMTPSSVAAEISSSRGNDLRSTMSEW